MDCCQNKNQKTVVGSQLLIDLWLHPLCHTFSVFRAFISIKASISLCQLTSYEDDGLTNWWRLNLFHPVSGN